MPSLVLELQQQALDPKVGIADLLRKAFVVAVKLNLERFKDWIELELNGYARTGKQPPDYRLVFGIIKVFDGYGGRFIPCIIEDDDEAEILSRLRVNSAITEVEAIAYDKRDSHVILSLSERNKIILMRRMRDDPMEPSLHVSRTSFARICDAIRNAVLKWSLELEKDGILGEGMSFSSEEKKIAAEKADELDGTVNITIIGAMTNSSLQQGSEGARQKHQAD